jgi:hypothetical protein
MALSSAIVWEVQTGGNDLNGGGFKTGATGTDYSYVSNPTSPHVIIDGATITATVNATTTKWDIAGYTTADTDIGNVVQISGGAMTAGFYEITGRTGTTQWTIDRAAGTAGQTGTGRMGGCLASPGMLKNCLNTGMKSWIKTGTYSITTTVAGSFGPLTLGSNDNVVIQGYATSRGDMGTRPIFDSGTQTGVTLISTSSFYRAFLVNMELNGNSGTGNNGFNAANSALSSANNCIFRNFNGSTTTYGTNYGRIHHCFATTCGIGFTNATVITDSVATLCTGVGIKVYIGSAVNCLAYLNAAGFLGLSGASFYGCIADSNTGVGFYPNSYSGESMTLINCIMSNNGSYGISNDICYEMINCANYNNTGGQYVTAPFLNLNPITLTAAPYTSPDFRPNTTAGGGAALRAAGIGVYGQIDARDVGAVQHADPTQPAVSNVKSGTVYNDGLSMGTYVPPTPIVAS